MSRLTPLYDEGEVVDADFPCSACGEVFLRGTVISDVPSEGAIVVHFHKPCCDAPEAWEWVGYHRTRRVSAIDLLGALA